MGDHLATIDMGPKLGGGVPLPGVAGSPSNTMSPEPRSTSVPSGILIHPAVWRQQTWAENWGLGSFMGELVLHLTHCGRGRGLPLYQVASWFIQPFGHNCRNAMLLRVGIRWRTIFIPSLDVKTFTGCVHWVIARYQLNSSKYVLELSGKHSKSW